MKKRVLSLLALFFVGTVAFAQSDLQVLAIVKYNKSESITVKQLKKRVGIFEKQVNRSLTVDEKKSVLDSLIEEKLMLQAAQKKGITIPDSTADAYFQQNLSQSLGVNVTVSELNDYFKKTQGKTLDEVLVAQVGMSTEEYKAYLKNQLVMQQYVMGERQAELQAVAPTDEEIRMAYEKNKASFVWPDMIKVFLVLVPKNGNSESAKQKAVNILDDYKNKKKNSSQIAIAAQDEKSGYQAGEILLPKNDQAANSIQMEFENLNFLFAQENGYVSDLNETENDWRFIAVLEKYQAKMLSLSDVVSPGTTNTVYEYIRATLAQQKIMIYMQTATQEISKTLRTADTVEMKKSGSALDELLKWGE